MIGVLGSFRDCKLVVDFLMQVAWAERANRIGDFAVDNLASYRFRNVVIPFLIRVFNDRKTCPETKISVANTLAQIVREFHGGLAQTAMANLGALTAVTQECLNHNNPTMRAFGCRLAGELGVREAKVLKMSRSDHKIFYSGSAVSDEASCALEKMNRRHQN